MYNASLGSSIAGRPWSDARDHHLSSRLGKPTVLLSLGARCGDADPVPGGPGSGSETEGAARPARSQSEWAWSGPLKAVFSQWWMGSQMGSDRRRSCF